MKVTRQGNEGVKSSRGERQADVLPSDHSRLTDESGGSEKEAPES